MWSTSVAPAVSAAWAIEISASSSTLLPLSTVLTLSSSGTHSNSSSGGLEAAQVRHGAAISLLATAQAASLPAADAVIGPCDRSSPPDGRHREFLLLASAGKDSSYYNSDEDHQEKASQVRIDEHGSRARKRIGKDAHYEPNFEDAKVSIALPDLLAPRKDVKES